MLHTQSSGIGVSDECVAKFEELRLGKVLKYIILEVAPNLQEIIVGKTSQDADYDKFLEDLPENECKWAIYDFAFEVDGGGKRNKIVLISWVPDDAKVKQKMIYASSKEALKRKLQSGAIAAEVQGTDYSEVAYEIGMFWTSIASSLHALTTEIIAVLSKVAKA
ncbi:actin depolymerizing protein [Calocera cornea HHB12733]|uniref:Cofilin n=1 Tax=Calocera cornea HHB12733 TaxID=1353952 RepID=A0A165F7F0_9BASI|nr:actin depolymerizing protein [Calocera cornea HHB12733]